MENSASHYKWFFYSKLPTRIIFGFFELGLVDWLAAFLQKGVALSDSLQINRYCNERFSIAQIPDYLRTIILDKSRASLFNNHDT